MSLPPQVNTDKSGKHRAAAMKEPVQHSGEVYYGMGPPALESSHSDSVSSSAVYDPEKGPQSLPHYQQAAPVKWMQQDTLQAPGWSQEAPVTAWGQNLTFTTPYMGGVNVRGQMAFHKGVHEGNALPMGGENQLPGPEVYRDASQAQAQGRGLEWDQHATAAMHQAQLQAYPLGHKGGELQGQAHVPSHTLQGSMLQPFRTTFGPNKQQFQPGFYSVFPGNKSLPNLPYAEQPKNQQLIHQMQQQQQQQQHHQIQQQQMHRQQQQQQQQQLHQQHQLQMHQQQQLQQQQHQIQQHQMQQQQLQQMQQQYHQQQIQERQQHIQQMQQQQQLQQQNVSQQKTTQLQMPAKQQQTQSFASYPSAESCPPDAASKEDDVQSVEAQQEPEAPTCSESSVPDASPEKVPANPAETPDAQQAAPRRSRRLSKEGQSPLGPPSTNIWSQASKEPPPSQNGVTGIQRGVESQVTAGGVIQLTRRRRRASKEINLETLAQKASEMESLPAKSAKEEGSSGRQATMTPLIIPVSVPVHRNQTDGQSGWAQGRLGQGERPTGQSDRKPSVIVARRRSIRNSMTESFGQDGENDPGLDEDGKSKLKRRPRPEPLFIPPPKPSTFIPPSLYSSITSYQSNLRSPVRLPDNPLTLPPYTPPPILSPVREGSGLYFSTFLTNIAASNQILPPIATPKSTTRSLLRSTSSEVTPPVLPMITDATPVSLEPRINIGPQYQAEVPQLQDQPSSQIDQHKADLVWLPVDNSHLKHGSNESMEPLMKMACSSVLRGGGTNQELVLHCLHECGGDFLETLGHLMLQDQVFPQGHHLTGYHYSGSDSWTAEEKRYFNKGISAYRKDFFLVQKLVRTKTVAQCVEFYYTFKKQMKVGRSGNLTFGPPDSPVEKHTDTVVDVKSSLQSKVTLAEANEDDKRNVYDHDSEHQARVAQSLQAHDYAGTVLVIKEPDGVKKEANPLTGPHRPRAEPAAKKSRAPVKPPQDPDAVFPCKKCGRVFYKVKSRSAHMKSHAEQEKKAAALRQREEQAAAEARARMAAAAAAAHQEGSGNGVMEQAEVSSQEDSSEKEDDDDEDWH